jgi:hypothetical protein
MRLVAVLGCMGLGGVKASVKPISITPTAAWRNPDPVGEAAWPRMRPAGSAAQQREESVVGLCDG